MLALFVGVSAHAVFTDVAQNSKYADAVAYLESEAIVQGYADGTFRPISHINRYDFLKIIIESVYPESVIRFCDISVYSFPDVTDGHWAEPYLCVAKREGVINGYTNGMYGGDDLVLLSQSLKIVLESFDVPLMTEVSGVWYAPYMLTANQIGLLENIPENPDYRLKRGDMALLIYRLRDDTSPIPTPQNSIVPSPNSSPLSTNIQDADYKSALATVFWAGEAATPDNGFITNTMSAWDVEWAERFGGYDNPNDRCGFRPCEFVPLENVFYFALPYNDLDLNGNRKASAELIPWFEEKKHLKTVIKNAWVEVELNGNVCYGQWQDVGPYQEDDFDYVFGDGEPTNEFGVGAGIDLSPALSDCLQMNGNQVVNWRFTADKDVPPGPWTQTVTTSEVNW